MVAVVKAERYPDAISLWEPAERYPEYPFPIWPVENYRNPVYAGVRQLFHLLGYDQAHEGTKGWNPLGHIVQPGDTVVVKPNFVLSRHKTGGLLWSVITHPSVLRAVVDYVWIALQGEGRIVIADAPQYDADPDELRQLTEIDDLCMFYDNFPGPTVQYRDLRDYWSPGRHHRTEVRRLPGDPEGAVTVDLGSRSAFTGLSRPVLERLYGARPLRDETVLAHTEGRHVYEVSGTMLDADVYISVPKLKTHKKVGVTLNLKNLVGIAVNKNLIPHYTLGAPSEGGDQYPDGLFNPVEAALIRLERWMYDHLAGSPHEALERVQRAIYWLHNHTTKRLGLRVAPWKRAFDAGNWYGNDTAWRAVRDLLHIITYADRDGVLHEQPQRRFFSVVDGVIGGQGDGPLAPDAAHAGVLIGGEDQEAVDLAATLHMGFGPFLLPLYAGHTRPFDVVTEGVALGTARFRPHPGWEGCIEQEPSQIKADVMGLWPDDPLSKHYRQIGP